MTFLRKYFYFCFPAESDDNKILLENFVFVFLPFAFENPNEFSFIWHGRQWYGYIYFTQLKPSALIRHAYMNVLSDSACSFGQSEFGLLKAIFYPEFDKIVNSKRQKIIVFTCCVCVTIIIIISDFLFCYYWRGSPKDIFLRAHLGTIDVFRLEISSQVSIQTKICRQIY